MGIGSIACQQAQCVNSRSQRADITDIPHWHPYQRQGLPFDCTWDAVTLNVLLTGLFKKYVEMTSVAIALDAGSPKLQPSQLRG